MFQGTNALPLLALAALLLAACGGGSSGEQLASLSGEVVEIDGQSAQVAGVVLMLAETGETAVTDADGAFAFPEAPTGTLILELVSSPMVAGAANTDAPQGPQGDDGHRHEGDDGHHGQAWDQEGVDDGEDAGDGDVVVHRVRDQERVHVRLRIRDGAICEMECHREQNRECELEVVMTATEDCDDDDLAGKLELETRDDRERFKVRVWNATFADDLEVVVIDLADDEDSLGEATVDADGEASWTLDVSLGDALPFDVPSVSDLEGYVVEMRDADTGTTLLVAEVPPMPAFEWQWQHQNGQKPEEPPREQSRNEDPALDRSGDLDHDRDQDQEGDRTGYDDNAENSQGG